jgi:SAM-dependent methyltransferase
MPEADRNRQGLGATVNDTVARLMVRTLGPLLRARGDGDSGFLDPKNRSHSDAMYGLTTEHWRRVVRTFGVVDFQTVLDVACGSGDLLAPLAESNSKVVGVDLDAEMLDLARARSSSAGNVEIREMSAESLAFDDGSFDAVTCFSALPYLDQERAISEIARVLRPGGRLVLGTVGSGYYVKHIAEGARHEDLDAIRYGLDPILVSAGRAMSRGRLAPTSLRTWSPRTVRRALEAHGLKVDRSVHDVDVINPGWPTSVLALPVYFVVFASKRAQS